MSTAGMGMVAHSNDLYRAQIILRYYGMSDLANQVLTARDEIRNGTAKPIELGEHA